MFEYLLVVASTIVYFKVFHWSDPDAPKFEKGTQTDPWVPLQTIDLMDISDSELSCKATFIDWESDSSEIELPPLVRHKTHGLKESRLEY